MKKRVKIEDIEALKDSFQLPDGYLDGLVDKINLKKDDALPFVSLNDIPALEESYEVPEGYFDGLLSKIEERKEETNDVVEFRSRRIKIWGSFVAAACITLVVLSVVKWGNNIENNSTSVLNTKLENIPDAEIAGLLDDRDDEFELTEEEIIEVITYETAKDESTAIIDYLEDEGTMDDELTDDEDFLESI